MSSSASDADTGLPTRPADSRILGHGPGDVEVGGVFVVVLAGKGGSGIGQGPGLHPVGAHRPGGLVQSRTCRSRRPLHAGTCQRRPVPVSVSAPSPPRCPSMSLPSSDLDHSHRLGRHVLILIRQAGPEGPVDLGLPPVSCSPYRTRPRLWPSLPHRALPPEASTVTL